MQVMIARSVPVHGQSIIYCFIEKAQDFSFSRIKERTSEIDEMDKPFYVLVLM